METSAATIDYEAVLEEWKQAFLKKRSNAVCPHADQHDGWFELKDLKYDGYGSFTYNIEACCEGFRILILQWATEERMYNPPKLKPDAPVAAPTIQRSETPAAMERKLLKNSVETTAVVQGVAHDHHNEMTRSSVERWFEEVWDERNEALIGELVDENCRVHSRDGTLSKGIEPFMEQYRSITETMPDLHVEAKYHVVEYDKAASLLLVSGTPKGGNRVEFTSMTFSRWRDGKIVEAWGLADLDSALLKASQ